MTRHNFTLTPIIKGYLPANALGVVYGASGSFKSFHTLSWAVHVALGREWNGCRVISAPVLYVAGEGGLGVPRRIKALADQYNRGKEVPGLYRLDHAVHIGDAAQVSALIKTVKEKAKIIGKSFRLVILDTLARCFNGDENKTEDMNRFVAACDRLKAETGATVLVVHHSGVLDKDRARGSSSLRAAADFEYRVERAKSDRPGAVVTSTKSKDEKEAPARVFWMCEHHLLTDTDGESVTSLVTSDKGEIPPEPSAEPEAATLPTKNEVAVWEAVRSRMASGDSTAVAVIRDDLKKLMGENARKTLTGG